MKVLLLGTSILTVTPYMFGETINFDSKADSVTLFDDCTYTATTPGGK